MFSLNLISQAGTYYDGNRFSLLLQPGLNIGSGIMLDGNYQLDKVTFNNRSQRYTNNIFGLRSTFMFTTNLTLTTYVQYNTLSHRIITNARIRYNAREGSDFYIVYNEGIDSLAKGTTDRYRPFTYLTLDQIDKLEGEAREQFFEDIAGDDIEDSFFSGDASSTAYCFIFIAKVFNDYFPDSKLKYGLWGLSITGTTLQAYFRSKSGKHFPTDVIVGSLVGGSLGFLIPYLHKEIQKPRLSLNPTSHGISLTYKF